MKTYLEPDKIKNIVNLVLENSYFEIYQYRKDGEDGCYVAVIINTYNDKAFYIRIRKENDGENIIYFFELSCDWSELTVSINEELYFELILQFIQLEKKYEMGCLKKVNECLSLQDGDIFNDVV